MKKLIILITLLLTLLVACEPEKYSKSNGEVIGKEIGNSKFGDSYYVKVAYPTKEDKFFIDYDTVSKEVYEKVRTGDKVEVYYNSNGVGQIVLIEDGE